MSRDKIKLKALLKEAPEAGQKIAQKEMDILRAAEMLFSEGGFDGITTAEIAKKAQVTERTLFKYFPTKQDLYKRILFPIVLKFGLPDQAKKVLRITEVDYATFKDFLKALAFNRFEDMRENRDRMTILFTELLHNDEFRSEFGKKFSSHIDVSLKKALNRMKAQGKVRQDIHIETMMRMILFTIMGYGVYRNIIAPKAQVDDEAEINSMVEALAKGLC